MALLVPFLSFFNIFFFLKKGSKQELFILKLSHQQARTASLLLLISFNLFTNCINFPDHNVAA